MPLNIVRIASLSCLLFFWEHDSGKEEGGGGRWSIHVCVFRKWNLAAAIWRLFFNLTRRRLFFFVAPLILSWAGGWKQNTFFEGFKNRWWERRMGIYKVDYGIWRRRIEAEEVIQITYTLIFGIFLTFCEYGKSVNSNIFQNPRRRKNVPKKSLAAFAALYHIYNRSTL